MVNSHYFKTGFFIAFFLSIFCPLSGENIPSRIRTNEDAVQVRENVINHIWKNIKISTKTIPHAISRNIQEKKIVVKNNYESIDKVTVQMEYGVNSIFYYFHPTDSKNKLAIYHRGHDFTGPLNRKVIEQLLKMGYTVIELALPLYDHNNTPTVHMKSFGDIKLFDHNQLALLESDNFSPIKFFIEPVIASINYAQFVDQFSEIIMIGLSGGGWCTVVASAVDPRIDKSYSIAGSVPFTYKNKSSDGWSDFEQYAPSFYKVANYLDLYFLAAYGNKRKHAQILNKNDPCCFNLKEEPPYVKTLQQKLSKLNQGQYVFLIDSTVKKHTISDHAIDFIADDLK